MPSDVRMTMLSLFLYMADDDSSPAKSLHLQCQRDGTVV